MYEQVRFIVRRKVGEKIVGLCPFRTKTLQDSGLRVRLQDFRTQDSGCSRRPARLVAELSYESVLSLGTPI
jgi:hypothetical protein